MSTGGQRDHAPGASGEIAPDLGGLHRARAAAVIGAGVAVLLLAACAPTVQHVSESMPVCVSLEPSLGVTLTPRMAVLHVHPASRAAQAGMQTGDVLLAIDGTRVASVDQARAALRSVASQRAGPCTDTSTQILNARGSVVGTAPTLPPTSTAPRFRITVRRGANEVVLHVDLRTAPSTPSGSGPRPTATPVPPDLLVL